MEDYLSLIDKAHERGIKVVMDLVLNHTSTANNWFIESANLNPDYRGYYQWGNHETDRDHIKEDNYWYPYGDHAYSFYAKFGSGMPELNYSYQATRDAVIDMSKKWCELGVDGFRLDAVKHIYMTDEVSSTEGDTLIFDITADGENYSSDLSKNLEFFDDLNEAIKSEYPSAFFVGENFDGHAYHVAPYYRSFDSMFDPFITPPPTPTPNPVLGTGKTASSTRPTTTPGTSSTSIRSMTITGAGIPCRGFSPPTTTSPGSSTGSPEAAMAPASKPKATSMPTTMPRCSLPRTWSRSPN